MPQAINFSAWAAARSTLQQRAFSRARHNLCPSSWEAIRTCRSASHPSQRPSLELHPKKSIASQYIPNCRAMSTASNAPDRYKLVFFVPTENAEACKEVIFAVGAGSFPGGKYTKCCFQTPGTGQFLPNEGANPAIGSVGEVERCEELRVEVMCLGRDVMLKAVEELVRAHPYEEVAYEVYRMENV